MYLIPNFYYSKNNFLNLIIVDINRDWGSNKSMFTNIEMN